MIQHTIKSLTLSLAALAITACGSSGNSDIPFIPPVQSGSVDLDLTAVAEEVRGGSFNWSSADDITLLYKRSAEVDFTQSPFSCVESGTNGLFSGSLWSWEGEKSLYAIYNRNIAATDWVLSSGNFSISQNDLSQTTLSFTSDNVVSAREQGVMVASVDGATLSSAKRYSIPELPFKQCAAYLQLDLSGTRPENRDITELSIVAEEQDTPFVSCAEVAAATGEIAKVTTYAHALSYQIENGESTARYLTLALLPAEISSSISLRITAKGVDEKLGWSWIYEQNLPSGLDLDRNNVTNEYLDWATLTERVITSVSTASDLSDMASSNATPEGDTWVIASDATNEAQAIEDLSTVLSNNSVESGSITVEMPSATTIPEGSFAGSAAGDNAALGTVNMTSVTSVGKDAFKENKSVKEIVLGDDETLVELEESVFEGCAALEVCEVRSAAFPKALFKGCSALKSVDLTSVTTIGESAFEGCTSLFNSVEPLAVVRSASECELVLNEVTEIGSRAFYNCRQFTVLRLNEGNDTQLESIAEDSFSGDGGSYAGDITLYVSGAMRKFVNMKQNTLSVGGVTLTFKNILVDGVDDEDTLGSGEDALVDII